MVAVTLRMMMLVPAISLAMLLTSCASVVLVNATIEQDKFAKRFTPPQDKSLIYVYLDDTSGSISKHLVVDGRVAGLVRPSVYLISNVAPGQHRLGVGHIDDDSILLETEPGKMYFITAHVACSDGKSRAQLQLVDDTTGRERVLAFSLANVTLFGRPLLNDKPNNTCRSPSGNA